MSSNHPTQMHRIKAFRLMEESLAILDRLDAPAEIGATLDLAINRLAEWLGPGDQTAPSAIDQPNPWRKPLR